MKKITYALSSLILLAFPLTALADKYGLSQTAGRAGLTRYGDSVPALAGSVVGTALSLISVIFFILIVYAGFLWMTARGKEDVISKAKDTIIAAIIGLIVVLASYAITNFVFSSVENPPGDGRGAEISQREECQIEQIDCEGACEGEEPCLAQCEIEFNACVAQE